MARELTKFHEDVWWGTLADARRRWADTPPRGEYTLVLAPAEGEQGPSVAEAAVAVRALVEAGARTGDAVKVVAELTGVSRRALYEASHGGEVR